MGFKQRVVNKQVLVLITTIFFIKNPL